MFRNGCAGVYSSRGYRAAAEAANPSTKAFVEPSGDGSPSQDAASDQPTYTPSSYTPQPPDNPQTGSNPKSSGGGFKDKTAPLQGALLSAMITGNIPSWELTQSSRETLSSLQESGAKRTGAGGMEGSDGAATATATATGGVSTA
eukprot:CAMPEP_0197865942 /NCGR_PEP_ID=MMETSP1438-20131217/43945_1 /TAXON_ID=1461541 /ORGANISM="Pterosperma sp., Strain CCMP1384" /LENGTH=144 /DNA_ID=CAMNT_0043484465 /DNA_START=942 /DNA_END=1372 /DNA_ORIENTATION=-